MPRSTLLAALAACLAVSSLASAQPRQPAEGSVAVGGAVSAFLPGDDAFETAPYFEGQVQFQFTPRVGVRFGVEYFFTRDAAFGGEARYQFDDITASGRRGWWPSA